MLKKNMETALNEQLNFELYSAYLYFSMAAYFEHMGLPGFSHWMKIQTQEEINHALKFYNFINERGGRVILRQIDTPPSEWKSPLDAFENALRHEQLVTERINRLMDLAMEKKDYATQNFLQWFVDEQVEEEASVGEVVNKLRLIGNERHPLFMLDRELSQRTIAPQQKGGEK